MVEYHSGSLPEVTGQTLAEMFEVSANTFLLTPRADLAVNHEFLASAD